MAVVAVTGRGLRGITPRLVLESERGGGLKEEREEEEVRDMVRRWGRWHGLRCLPLLGAAGVGLWTASR